MENRCGRGMKLAKAMEEVRLGCENRSATVIVVI